jgi:hypothetical protein
MTEPTDYEHIEFVPDGTTAVEACMRHLESILDKEGWGGDDPHSRLFLVGRSGLAPELSVAALEVYSIPMPEGFYEDPVNTLKYFVEFLKQHEDSEIFLESHRRILRPSFHAAIMFAEGWQLPNSVPEDDAQIWHELQLFHEHPERIEGRLGVMATVEREIYAITRTRGKEPFFCRTEAGPNSDVAETITALQDFALHLRRMADRIYG